VQALCHWRLVRQCLGDSNTGSKLPVERGATHKVIDMVQGRHNNENGGCEVAAIF